ncbi:type VI secretion system tip protein VgrG [Reichenbachiella versicolor]|uniref:type VI secretion system tip protein VgrG n=1 Tax=Reichenbachiella versicolor TaxID=1821036 RepID=UPI000D6E4C24|nr:type VI secretion system tip protein VgrG [Reichenbachiella versicolor]
MLANNDKSVVTHQVLVDGVQLETSYFISAIYVSKEINRVASAKLTFSDGGLGTDDEFRISDSGILEPGKKVEIKVGYNTDEKSLFEGIVTKNSLTVNDVEGFVLTVECKDPVVKMTVGRKNSVFYEKKDSDIINELVKASGSQATVGETSTEHEEMIQHYISDWDFMLMRAEANGFIVANSDGELIVDKPSTKQSKIEVRFDGTIRSFDAVLDAQNQLAEAEVTAWDRSEQKLVNTVVKAPKQEKQGGVRSSKLAEVIGVDTYTMQSGANVVMSDLQAWGESKLLKSELSKIKGSVTIGGTSDAELDTWFKLEGVGKTFDGDAYISGVYHRIEDGDWETELRIGLSEGWYVDHTPNIAAMPASGISSPIHGLHIGIVKQIHEDPMGDHRIQVSIPTLQQDNMPVWARVSNLYSSKGAGFFFMPELEDEVVLGFFNDDPNFPVVLGSMYNKMAEPAYVASENNEIKSILTTSKLEIQFNEEEKKITILTPEGQKIVLDDNNKSLTLMDEANSNEITLGNGGLQINSAEDIVLFAEGNISMKSNGNIELMAEGDLLGKGMNVEIKADTKFSAEGAQAELKGSASTVIEGGLVQIN